MIELNPMNFKKIKSKFSIHLKENCNFRFHSLDRFLFWQVQTWFMATSSSISWLALAGWGCAAAGEGRLRWVFSFCCCCCDSSLGLVGAVCCGGICCWCWLLLEKFQRTHKHTRKRKKQTKIAVYILNYYLIEHCVTMQLRNSILCIQMLMRKGKRRRQVRSDVKMNESKSKYSENKNEKIQTKKKIALNSMSKCKWYNAMKQ